MYVYLFLMALYTNVSITINYTMCPIEYKYPEQINGLLFYYDHWKTMHANMQLNNFRFTAEGLCSHPLQYVMTFLLFQKISVFLLSLTTQISAHLKVLVCCIIMEKHVVFQQAIT